MSQLQDFLRNRRLYRQLRRQARDSQHQRGVLGPFAKGVLYETESGLFVAPTGDIAMGHRLGFEGAYDREEIVLYRELVAALPPGSNGLIVGSHIGYVAVSLAASFGQIFCIEADPRTHWYLERNLELNRVGNARAFNFAASSSEGTATFISNVENTAGSKVMPKKDGFEFTYDDPAIRTIEKRPVDSLGLPPIAFALLDVEGHEYECLQGMGAVLENTQVLVVEMQRNLIEKNEIPLDAMIGLLKERYGRCRIANRPDLQFDWDSLCRFVMAGPVHDVYNVICER